MPVRATFTQNINPLTPQENVILLKEINDLRTELKRSRTQAHDLEATLKIAKKQGFGDTTTTINIGKAHMGRMGQLNRVEPHDESRIIEMQKIEIERLRVKIRELSAPGSGGRKTQSGGISSGERLPPMKSSVIVS